MSSTKSTELPPTMTAPWTEPEPLADVPGGEPNLLHRSAWSDPANPLKVMLEPWYDEDPPGGPYTERVDVFLGDNESNIIGFTVSEDEVLPSQKRTLNVLDVDSTHFPTVQCQEAFGGQLSIGSVPDGAHLRLDPWKLATTDQKIWISMTGIVPSGPADYWAIDGRKVTQAEVDHGVARVWDRILIPRIRISIGRNTLGAMAAGVSPGNRVTQAIAVRVQAPGPEWAE